jgi:DNA-binding response OmpR family regulator
VDPERGFFALVQGRPPDVIVLDLSSQGSQGLEAIRKIREQCSIPILVVHASDDTHGDDYRVCGAAGCVTAPIDIVTLNTSIQRIIELTKSADQIALRPTRSYSFGGMIFRPDRNVLEGSGGANVKLTTMEKDLLSHLASRARTVCSRAEIARVLYGDHPPVTDRAIDVIVNRLRKKIVTVGGQYGSDLLQTEFRRGYVFASDVAPGT